MIFHIQNKPWKSDLFILKKMHNLKYTLNTYSKTYFQAISVDRKNQKDLISFQIGSPWQTEKDIFMDETS